MTKYGFLIILLNLLIFNSALYSYTQDSLSLEDNDSSVSLPVIENDSTITDSLATEQQLVPDSLRKPNNPMHKHGSVFLLNNRPYKTINKKDYRYLQYSGLSEIIGHNTLFFPVSTGTHTRFNSFSVFGASADDINVNYNGRPINDFQYGSYNLEQFSPEFLENIELLTGSDAVIFSDNSSGAMANLQQIRYNTAKPYTRIMFAQAGYDQILADGIYSQNFTKDWNFTFGFKTTTAKGRYDNNNTDTWNIRALIRWNPSDMTSISITENFNNHTQGLYGGIDSAASYYNFSSLSYTTRPAFDFGEDAYNQVLFANLLEKQFRHDLTLSYTSILDEDSTHALSINSWFSHAAWDRSSSSGYFISDTIEGFSDKYLNKNYGANAKYEVAFANSLFLNTGAEIYYVSNEQSLFCPDFEGMSTAFFGRARLFLFDVIDFSGGARLRKLKDREVFSAGVKGSINILKNLSLTGDFSRSENLPSPVQGFELNKESNLLAIFDLNYSLETFSVHLNAFYRKTDNPILNNAVYSTAEGEEYKIISTESFNAESGMVQGSGISLNYIPQDNVSLGTYRWLPVNLTLKGTVYKSEADGEDGKRYPGYYAGARLSSQIQVNQSIARIGVDFKIMGPFNGEQYIPLTRTFVQNNFDNGTMHNGIDIFVEAKLGNAYLRLTLENILDKTFYYNPLHLYYGRNFRFMLNWSFLD